MRTCEGVWRVESVVRCGEVWCCKVRCGVSLRLHSFHSTPRPATEFLLFLLPRGIVRFSPKPKLDFLGSVFVITCLNHLAQSYIYF